MAKGLGIAALIIALLAFFVPIYGFIASLVACLIAAIGALAGERTFAVVVPIISALNIFALSPSFWAMMAGSPSSGGWMMAVLIGLATPIIGIILNASGKLAIGGSNAA